MKNEQQSVKSEKKIKERFHRKVGKHNTTEPLNSRINLSNIKNDNKENIFRFEEYDSKTLNQSNKNDSQKKENSNLHKDRSQRRLNYTYVESKYSKKNINDNSNFRENRRLNETTNERGKRNRSVEYNVNNNSRNDGKPNYSVATLKPITNIKNLSIISDKKIQVNQDISPKTTLPFSSSDNNKYDTNTFSIPSIISKMPIEIKKETKPEMKTISHKQIGIFADLSKINLGENKNTNKAEEKTIIRRRRPNFPKYERRISDKNITVNDNKKKKQEEKKNEKVEKVEKVEKHEQAPVRKRRRSIGPPLRRESTKHFQEVTSKTYANITEATSTPGRDDDGLTKINQDTYILEKNINGILNFNIFGVLDGHGVNGHFASQFVKRYIFSRIKNHPSIRNLDSPKEIYKKLIENGYQIIANIFLDADVQITKEKFNCEMSGTTCVIVIQLEEYLICANTGDSRAILIYEDINSKNLSNTKIYPLSYDCKPELPNEKKRIEESGGSVEQIMDEGDIPCGPFRVWIKGEEYPGLAMSRSIGDMDAKKVGVIPNPQIIEYHLNPQSKYMIICSDGIWEFISNEECMKIANRYYLRSDAIGLCNDLTNISTANWLKEDIVVDDITCVVVFF